MDVKTKTIEVFISQDGKEFLSEEDCAKYEKKLIENKKRVEKLNVYHVNHSFDATEGRGYYGATYIVTDQQYPVILQYAFDRWGNPLSKWYGNGYYQKWIISSLEKSKLDFALCREGENPQKYHHKTDIVFISDKPLEYKNLPEPVFPWGEEYDNTEQWRNGVL